MTRIRNSFCRRFGHWFERSPLEQDGEIVADIYQCRICGRSEQHLRPGWRYNPNWKHGGRNPGEPKVKA